MIKKLPGSKQQSAFTLIELLIVIALLGILAVVLLAIFNPLAQMQKARDSRRKTDLREIKTSLMLYRNICGSLPQSAGDQIVGCGNDCGSVGICDWGESWTVGTTQMMKILPQDPQNSGTYKYDKIDEEKFRLIAILENKNDSAGSTSRTQCGYAGDPNKNEYVVCED